MRMNNDNCLPETVFNDDSKHKLPYSAPTLSIWLIDTYTASGTCQLQETDGNAGLFS